MTEPDVGRRPDPSKDRESTPVHWARPRLGRFRFESEVPALCPTLELPRTGVVRTFCVICGSFVDIGGHRKRPWVRTMNDGGRTLVHEGCVLVFLDRVFRVKRFTLPTREDWDNRVIGSTAEEGSR